MPIGKVRTGKRASSGSYTSTVTVVVFIALCVLGVWMLTSNSVIPSQTSTSRVATSSNEASLTTDNEPKNSGTFQDNPGQLPDDATKQDERPIQEEAVDIPKQEPEDVNRNNNIEENVSESGENQISEESTLTTQAIHQEIKKDPSSKGNQNQASSVQQEETPKKSKAKKKKDPPKEVVHDGISQEQADHDNQMPQETEPKTSIISQEKPQESSTLSQPKTSLETQDRPQEMEPKTSIEIQDKPQETSTVSQTETKPSVETQEKSTTQSDSDTNIKTTQPNTDNSYLGGGANMGIPKESRESKRTWSTQADQSENQKERKQGGTETHDGTIYGYTWHLCNVTAGPDYIPCLDNEKAIKKLHSRKHYEHRERHCPEDPPTCLVSQPQGYKKSIEWPHSRDKIWYHNVPHKLLAEVKGHQNWVKLTGEFLTFPGGGTQFIHGALHYIDFVQEVVPDIAWGKRTRVILDVGCGVASFGGFLFERDVLAMSLAPKDEHEAQVQFALERGIPAISAVMGTQRLQFPSMVFDAVHCARCRVPWHVDGGALLLELNRVLRPGGYFLWSATPVYQTLEEDVEIWKEMTKLTKAICWELVAIRKDKINSAGIAIYHKTTSNVCYDQREQSVPPICKLDDDPNAAWYVALQSCMHRVPESGDLRGSKWPESWPRRVEAPPYWLNKSQMGIYGKPAPDDFAMDYEHWKGVVNKNYLNGLGISWAGVRNVMDMRAVYGGFAAALKDMKLWVMNVVNIDSPDTLPIIYERGLFGIYHDWCEGFSTYPRSYDLLHADHLFSKLKKRCKLPPVMAEIDRILRPGGKLIVRDDSKSVGEVENLLKSLHWEVRLTFSKNQEGILSAQKGSWRPDTYVIPS